MIIFRKQIEFHPFEFHTKTYHENNENAVHSNNDRMHYPVFQCQYIKKYTILIQSNFKRGNK